MLFAPETLLPSPTRFRRAAAPVRKRVPSPSTAPTGSASPDIAALAFPAHRHASNFRPVSAMQRLLIPALGHPTVPPRCPPLHYQRHHPSPAPHHLAALHPTASCSSGAVASQPRLSAPCDALGAGWWHEFQIGFWRRHEVVSETLNRLGHSAALRQKSQSNGRRGWAMRGGSRREEEPPAW